MGKTEINFCFPNFPIFRAAMSALLALLIALAQSLPGLERLFRGMVTELDAQRAREAAQRLADKDKAVDAAVDGAGSKEQGASLKP
jgi:hypothetical protein